MKTNTIAELTARYNTAKSALGEATIGLWKGSKDALITKIETAEAKVAGKPLASKPAEETSTSVEALVAGTAQLAEDAAAHRKEVEAFAASVTEGSSSTETPPPAPKKGATPKAPRVKKAKKDRLRKRGYKHMLSFYAKEMGMGEEEISADDIGVILIAEMYRKEAVDVASDLSGKAKPASA